MPLKLKLNTFQRKLKKLLLNTNQSKESGKEFNIFQYKLKSFITQKEITTSHNQEKLFKEVTLNQIKAPPMSQVKVESELKLYTKPDIFQLDKLLTQLDIKEDILKED
jgi:hypothetical protein